MKAEVLIGWRLPLRIYRISIMYLKENKFIHLSILAKLNERMMSFNISQTVKIIIKYMAVNCIEGVEGEN